MNQAQDLISDLPFWAQILLLGIVAIVGIFFGKRGVRPGKSPRDPHRLGKWSVQRSSSKARDIPRSAWPLIDVSYAPLRNDEPDPGEVVWTWVPFVEQDGRGKDRPVLIIGKVDAHTVAGCYLSTRKHHGFMEIGSGPWDPRGRESFLNPERILAVPHTAMRREGAAISRHTFERVLLHLTPHLKDNFS